MKLLKRLKKLIKPAIDYALKPDTLFDDICDGVAGEFAIGAGIIPCILLLAAYINLINTIPL